MIEREIRIPIEVTPSELAFEFCNMRAEDQARFFSEISRIVDKWEKPFCFQLQYLIGCKELTPDGRYVMEQIGDYGDDSQ